MSAGDYAAGGGSFGTWTTDEFGLPAYRYELDQHRDPRGTWDTRLRNLGAAEGGALDREAYLFGRPGAVDTNHSTLNWHQLGNDRLIAITTNDGWTQLYSHEFGPRWINMYRPEQGAFAGGLSYVADDNGSILSTLYPARPDTAVVERLWGCSYSRYTIASGGLALTRTVFAPFGDSPFLIALISLRNTGSLERAVRHLEYWDLHIHSLDATGPNPWQFDTGRRDILSSVLYSDYSCAVDEASGALVARHPWREIITEAMEWPGAQQRNRPDVSLVPLGVDPTDWVTDRAQLFPSSDPARPGPLIGEASGEATAEAAEERSLLPVLAAISQHVLQPGEEAVFGYAYGATPATETALEIAHVRDAGPGTTFRATMQAWRDTVPSVDVGDPDLARELAWSTYYLRSGSVYHRGLRAHTLPQGGAYQYIGGVNAGPRATLQHSLPLIWTAPELTRETLRFTFQETHPLGEMPYAEVANGMLEMMRYIPSDHDLWLLWAASDYVLGTRDRSFLREVCSYWPPPYTRPEPVWDHCVKSFHHLRDQVGCGSHGLLRMRTSDWNDAIIREGGVPMDRVWAEGESTLNTAMAVHVLRRFAELARYAGAPAIASESDAFAERLADAVRSCWRGRQLNRGWRDAESEVGYSGLYLEPQPWALIADILDSEQARTLVDEITTRCADPNGTRIFASGEEGNPPTAGGGQWLSINSTLVWGLSRVDVERAWSELKANTLHNHAENYPDIWFGIWSGPDTYLPATSRFKGQTWAWPGIFGMQAWPVQILFSHSETLNSLIWSLGIEGRADRLVIIPRVPFETWSWRSTSLSVDYGEKAIAVAYRGVGPEQLTVEVGLPSSWQGASVVVEDAGGARTVERAGTTIKAVLAVVPAREAGFVVSRR